MTKSKKRKYLLIGLACGLIGTLAVGTYSMLPTASANAEEAETEITDEFVITDTKDEVLATYIFARLNDTDCSVKISNKSVATKAVIPSTAEIDGKTYRVTEIAANGFLSANKLVRVSLPASIKKIGNMAFYNCSALTRISLANVEEIGNSAFYKCTALENLIIPKSVEKVGTNVLRYCNTAVKLRAESTAANWSASWNTGNENQEIEYNCSYVEPLELETVYNTKTRAGTPFFEGYIIAGGQPRTDNFYFDVDDEGNNIFIPNMYNGEYILGIASTAFEGNNFNQLVVEYSSKEFYIGFSAFEGAECKNITINRHVNFVNHDTNEISENIFTGSTIESVVLPDTITKITAGMFVACENLTNIYFHSPEYLEKREDMLAIVATLSDQNDARAKEDGYDDGQGIVYLTKNANLDTIGESAFAGIITISDLYIYSNVKNVSQFIVDSWTSEQTVHIQNDDIAFTAENGFNWHPDWAVGSDAKIDWTTTYHAITFNPDGGSVEITAIDVKENEAIGELPVPTKPHNTFMGWADSDGNIYTAETVYSLQSDLELTAQWSVATYTFNYVGNRPDTATELLTGNMAASTHSYDVASKLTANQFEVKGWHFIGWNTKADKSGVDYADEQEILNLDVPDGEVITLYAHWAMNTYSIEYAKNNPYNALNIVEGTMESSSIPYEALTTLSANGYTLKGWHFIGWNTKADGAGVNYSDEQAVQKLNPNDNGTTILYAQWEMNSYSVEYEKNKPDLASNTVEGSMLASTHYSETRTTLNKNSYTLKGWHFTGWNTKADGTGASYSDEQLINLEAENGTVITLYSQWVMNTYTVEYKKNKPNSATNNVEGAILDSTHYYENVKTLNSNNYTLKGWRFIGWNTKADGSGISYLNEQQVSKLNSNDSGTTSLYAQWAMNKYSIEYKENKPTNATNNVQGNMVNSIHSYETAESLSKNEYTLTGWHFTGWNTKSDGTGTSYSDEQSVSKLNSDNNGIATLYAQWSLNEYTAVYEKNRPDSATNAVKGEMINSVHTYESDKALNKNTYTLEGWHFTGWNTKANGTGINYSDEQIFKLAVNHGTEITLFAQWAMNNYSIEYNKNKPATATSEVQGVMSNSTHAYETAKALTTNAYTLTGWRFTGWNTKADGTGTPYTNEQVVSKVNATNNATTTLYAQWIAKTYSVSYNKNKPATASNSVRGTMLNSSHNYDVSKVLNKNAYTLEGWTFTGWNTQVNGTGTRYSDEQAVKNLNSTDKGITTLYAQWSQNSYTITYNKNRPTNASNSVSGTMSDSTHYYDTFKALNWNNYSLTGWTFIGWNTKADGSGTNYTDHESVRKLNASANGTTILYAQWEQNSWTVHYEPNQPETYYTVQGTMNNSLHSYEGGYYLNDNKFTLKGWKFKGWNTRADGNGTNYSNKASIRPLITVQDGLLTLYAQWEIELYTINYNYSRGVNPSGNPRTYTVDDTITFLPLYGLTNETNTWSPASISKGLTGNKEIIANYAERKLYVNCFMNDGSTSYRRIEVISGGSITLEPATRSGYYFGGWKYNGEYIVSIENIQNDMNLYAVWIPKSGNVYYMDANATQLTVSGATSIIELPVAFNNYRVKIVVTSAVRQLIVHSDSYRQYYFHIECQSRTQDIDITLLNMFLTPYDFMSAIGPESSGGSQWSALKQFDLNINLFAYNCEIGGQTDSNAIICTNITFYTPITIEGAGGSPRSGPRYAVDAKKSVTISSCYVTLIGGAGYDCGGAGPIANGITETYTKDIYRSTSKIIAGENDDG